MLSRPINLAIVDDHALFRKTLKNFLSEQHNMNVVVQASDIFDLLNKLKSVPVDVLLMDLFMPELNENEALKLVRSEHPDIRILILSMSTDMDLISDLLDTGIHGYVSKGDEPEDLLQAIKAVSENRLYRNRLITEALYRSREHNINTKADNERLTVNLNEREKKILQLIWEEKSNKEIAEELFLGIRSIEKIRQDLKEKIAVKSTVGLLKYAISRKIIRVGPFASRTTSQAHQ
ncbi:MAG: response regulator transcription factor [Chitinophagaceae bacterium]|nr:response regulator transcription factor [Chitinophagaceae bacterium]